MIFGRNQMIRGRWESAQCRRGCSPFPLRPSKTGTCEAIAPCPLLVRAVFVADKTD